DIVIGLVAATVVALLWKRPWIRPGRLLLGALTTAIGLSAALWPVVLVGAVLLILAVNPERLRAGGQDVQ
ncbi:MAG: hypothetical protein JJU06_01520, partial [Ectothiorhodospiraceae bacterium]|nr:hypothetical protein [Ectothiorhodospiraceae bacterium]